MLEVFFHLLSQHNSISLFCFQSSCFLLKSRSWRHWVSDVSFRRRYLKSLLYVMSDRAVHFETGSYCVAQEAWHVPSTPASVVEVEPFWVHTALTGECAHSHLHILLHVLNCFRHVYLVTAKMVWALVQEPHFSWTSLAHLLRCRLDWRTVPANLNFIKWVRLEFRVELALGAHSSIRSVLSF